MCSASYTSASRRGQEGLEYTCSEYYKDKLLPVTSNRYVRAHLLLPGPRHTDSSGVTELISSDTSPLKQFSNSLRVISSLGVSATSVHHRTLANQPSRHVSASYAQEYEPWRAQCRDLQGSTEGQLRPSRTSYMPLTAGTKAAPTDPAALRHVYPGQG